LTLVFLLFESQGTSNIIHNIIKQTSPISNMPQYYQKQKSDPLTEEQIKERYKEAKEELKEVMVWKKEEEAKLKDPKAIHQKISAAKRALKKVAWRINTVKGQILYWKMRVAGESHFKANIEKNEFWAKCKEKMEGKKG